MVAGLIIPIALIGLALVFRKDITNFLSLGISGLGEDLGKFGAEQQKAFDDFITQTQGDIDKTLGDLNQAGVDAQANVNQFFIDANKNLENNLAGIGAGVEDIGKNFETGLGNVQKDIDQFGKDIQTNIIGGVEGIQKDFDDFFSPIFGGQKPTKEIPKTINDPRDRNRPSRGGLTKPDIVLGEKRTVKAKGLTREQILDLRRKQADANRKNKPILSKGFPAEGVNRTDRPTRFDTRRGTITNPDQVVRIAVCSPQFPCPTSRRKQPTGGFTGTGSPAVITGQALQDLIANKTRLRPNRGGLPTTGIRPPSPIGRIDRGVTSFEKISAQESTANVNLVSKFLKPTVESPESIKLAESNPFRRRTSR